MEATRFDVCRRPRTRTMTGLYRCYGSAGSGAWQWRDPHVFRADRVVPAYPAFARTAEQLNESITYAE